MKTYMASYTVQGYYSPESAVITAATLESAIKKLRSTCKVKEIYSIELRRSTTVIT